MDERTRNRLFVGFITTWISKLASSIIQFVQIPVLFHYWTTPLIGEWSLLDIPLIIMPVLAFLARSRRVRAWLTLAYVVLMAVDIWVSL